MNTLKSKKMKKFLCMLVCAVLFVGCTNNDDDNELIVTKEKLLLNEKLTGKYKLVSCVADKALDLNDDGKASTNLFEENSLLKSPFLEMIIIVPTNEFHSSLKDNEFVFSEFWPTENDLRFKSKDDPILPTNDPIENHYDIYGYVLIGKFDADAKFGYFSKDKIEDDGKNTLLDIKIETMDNDEVKVISTRKFYTLQGWVTANTESIYKRYTKRT